MKAGHLVLFLLVLACTFSIITSQHAARKLFIEIERGHALAKRLDTEFRQLQVEQTSLSKPALVDEAARRSLGMERVTPAHVLYLTLPPAPAPVAGQGAAQ
jgi:cell division protein FtsL